MATRVFVDDEVERPGSNAIDLYDRDAVDDLARCIRDMLLSKGAA